MQHKTFELLESKADEETGTFTALASVFGNVDKGGDRMLKGAFTKTLDKWRKSGKFIPIIVSHNWDDLDSWVGKADPRAIYEDERGLVVQGKLNMDEESGRKVHRLMKEGLLTGWSFGYSVPAGGQEKKDGANEVSEVELFETGPTLVGMNPEAHLEAVKQVDGIPAEDVDWSEEAKDEFYEKYAEWHKGKAVWSAAYINTLPDSSFLYIESGGTKDDEGKTTPRSLRHFPVKDAEGNVDMPHLRNALSRIPQSNLPQSVKDRATAAAQRMMNNQSSLEPEEKQEQPGANEEPETVKSRPDALKERSLATSLEVLSEGVTLKKPDPPPPEDPELDYWTLKERSRSAVVDVLRS